MCLGNRGRLYSGYPVLFVECCLEKGRETCCRAFGQLTEQFAIIEEIPTDDLWDAEDVLPVRYGVQYVVLKMPSELNCFLHMARGKDKRPRW